MGAYLISATTYGLGFDLIETQSVSATHSWEDVNHACVTRDVSFWSTAIMK